jgi:hypothetical protein
MFDQTDLLNRTAAGRLQDALDTLEWTMTDMSNGRAATVKKI